MYFLQMKTCAIALALLSGRDKAEVSRLLEDAKLRAKRIFTNGEDWRRELKLYETLNLYLMN